MKTLIVYATKTGTTQKAAKMIAEKLKDKPDMVDLNVTKKVDVLGYDFVLVGGPINMGKLNRTVKRFLAKNREALMAQRFGLFLACGYPKELDKYLAAILDADMLAHAEVKTDIGYAYYLDKLGPIGKRVVMELTNTTETVEAYKPGAIANIAKVING